MLLVGDFMVSDGIKHSPEVPPGVPEPEKAMTFLVADTGVSETLSSGMS